MKKKIVLGVCLVLIAAVVSFSAWQWNNICAIFYGLRYSEEELAQMAIRTEEVVNEHLRNNNLKEITPMTAEQEVALNSGEITEDDAIRIMTGTMTFEEAKEKNQKSDSHSDGKSGAVPGASDNAGADNKSGENGKNNSGKTDDKSENVGNSTDYDTLISEKVAQLYVVKSKFYSSFNAKWAVAKANFLALPKEEQKKSKKTEIVKNSIPEGLAMEKECDTQVEAILSELTDLLKKAGRDDSLVSAIRTAYNQEKQTMKARLVNKYF